MDSSNPSQAVVLSTFLRKSVLVVISVYLPYNTTFIFHPIKIAIYDRVH